MRRIFIALVIAQLFILLSPVVYGGQSINPAGEKTTVVVEGKGDVRVTPDMAILNIGVEVTASTADEAQRKNASIMSEVLSTLSKFDIKETEIKTVSFYLWRATEYREGKEVFKGFKVVHTLEVPVTDITKVAKILDAVIKAGVNAVNQVYYSVQDTTEGYNTALVRAVDDAKNKANILAKIQGRKVEKLEKIVEKEIHGPYYGAEDGAGGSSITPFVPGQLKIEARVEATFILSDK